MDQGRRIKAALLAAGLLGAAAQSAGAAPDATMCGAAGNVASATGYALPPACVEAVPGPGSPASLGDTPRVPALTFCGLAGQIVGATGYAPPPECASA